jgi:CHAT domain-containing protein
MAQDMPKEVMKVYHAAEQYKKEGKHAKVLACYKEAVDIYAKKVNKKTFIYGVLLVNLAELYRKRKDYTQAEPLYLEAIEIFNKTNTKETPDYLNSLYGLAELYRKKKDYPKAEPFYLEAIKVMMIGWGKKHENYNKSLYGLAESYREMGKYTQAEPFFLENLSIIEKTFGKEHIEYTYSLNDLAGLYQLMGKYTQAEPLYLKSLEIKAKISGKESYAYATSLNNLALLYSDMGSYAKAEPFYLEVKEIFKNTLGKEHPYYAISLCSLGILYYNLGNYTQAEPLFLEAKEILSKISDEQYFSYTTSLNSLATLYNTTGNYTKAEPLYLEVSEILAKNLSKNHPQYAISLGDLALLYSDKGDYVKSEVLYLEAKEILRKTLGKDHPQYAILCNNLASLYDKQGKYAQAEPLYLEAKEIYDKVQGKDHLYYATSCNSLANLYDKLEKYIQAESLFLEGNHSFLTQIERNFYTLSEKEKGLYYHTFSSSLEMFISFVIHRYDQNKTLTGDVYNNALATKALLFNSSKKMRERISNSKDESLKTIFEDWKNKKEYLSKVYSLTIAERQTQGIDINKLENEVNDLEKMLSQRSEIFASQNDKRHYTWQDVQKSLKANEVAIEILRTNVYDKKWLDSVHYVALIVSPESKYPEMVLLKNGKDLENKSINYYKNCIKLKKEDKESYQKYWYPLKKTIKNAKKVYFSGDGVYHQISLLGLKNTETQKYLNEEIEIQLLGNTKDLVTSKPNAQSPKKINILAYPDYKKGSKSKPIELNQNQKDIKRFFESSVIAMLPGTQKEANQIEKTFQSQGLEVQKFLLEQASEETLKKLESTDVLHIATHGFFMEDVSENLNENKGTFLNNTQKLIENPLLRSGLLLAGAEIGIQGEHGNNEDGILTAYEAQNLNLDNTQLVVLSACETGQGKIKSGEGVFGLQRAFRTAGAKSILISLWKVDDIATQELMSSFYENWIAKKMNKREAFKKAQEEIKKKYTHPYYWAAFVLVGE